MTIMSRLFFFQDAIAAVILAIFFLCGMAPAASYASQWGEPPFLCEALQIPEVMEVNTLNLTCDDQELTAVLATLSVSSATD